MAEQWDRREVLGGLAAGAALSQSAGGQTTALPRRPLGKTGVEVSSIGLGGFHIGQEKLTDEQSVKMIRTALDRGMNFMDNCWDYNKGASEIRMGNALRDGYREKAFLMTKFDGRDKKTAMLQMEESLRRLQTDQVDLMQYHEVIRYDDVDRFFAPGGAGEALTEFQKAGKTRFIGFTGHKDPAIHLYMLQQADARNYRFDAVQLPLNLFDAHYRSFEKQVLPELTKRGIGVLGMKPMGGGVLLKAGVVSPEDCLNYALSLPTSVVITGMESEQQLEQAFRVGTAHKTFSKDQVSSLLSKTQKAAMSGEYELFKTTAHFDGTAENPEWLGKPTPRVQELGTP